MLFSSHNLSEVERICDRVAVIRNGKLAVVSSLEDLRNQHQIEITLKLKKPVEQLFIHGTKIISLKNNVYKLKVEGDINTVIHELHQLDIDEIYIPEPSLEDIFKSYYETN